jgi:hypothetical protein
MAMSQSADTTGRGRTKAPAMSTLAIAVCLAVWMMVSISGPASAAQVESPQYSPQLLAYCTKLYGLWNRYGHHSTFHHTGQRARAELALHRCEKGAYQAGFDELEVVLERNLLALPPASQSAINSR